MIDRRSFLQLALAAQAFAVLPARASTPGLRMGEPQPFSYDWLKSHAQALAGAAYSPPPRPDPKIVSSIDYDAHGQLHYKTDLALFGDGDPGAYPITFHACGAVLPQDRAHVQRGAERGPGRCPRNPLRSQLFRHSARKRRGTIACRPVAHGGLLGARAEGRNRGLAQGRALDHVPGRLLFPGQRRAWPGRHVRERDCAQPRRQLARGIPGLRWVLVCARPAGVRNP